MNSRREFLSVLGIAAGMLALSGCLCPPCHQAPRLAFQLAPLHDYIAGKADDAGTRAPGAGLARAFRALKAMGYAGVEFDDNYGNDAKMLKAMLADSGLAVCGRQVTKAMLSPEKISETCEFEINYGNNLLVCADREALSDAAFCEAAVKSAAKCGCRLVWRGAGDGCATTRLVRPAEVAALEDFGDWMAEVEAQGVQWFVVTTEPCDDLSAALAAREFFRTKGL